MSDLAKLNRLRENAGMKPLKSWKASKDKLQEKIDDMIEAGNLDVLPGANTEAAPKTDDPQVAKARPDPVEPEKKEPKVTQVRPGLGRGVENDLFGRGCRQSIRDHRKKEREEAKAERKNAAELSDEDKRQIKDEARLRGAVDPKKDPAKAKRQADKVKAKQEKRKASGRTVKKVDDNEITVADLARELKISPKIARAKLRRHEDKIKDLHTKGQDRWVFPKSAADKLKAILS